MDEKNEQYKKRKTKIIKHKLQFKYTVIVLLLMVLTGIIVAWGTYCLDRAIVNQLVAINIFRSLMIAWVLLLLAVGIGLSILVSHRIAGPIYRFEQFLDEVATGDLKNRICLRKNDELQELAQKFNNTFKFLQQEIMKSKSIAELAGRELEEISDNLKSENTVKSSERLKEIANKIKAVNDRFIG